MQTPSHCRNCALLERCEVRSVLNLRDIVNDAPRSQPASTTSAVKMLGMLLYLLRVLTVFCASFGGLGTKIEVLLKVRCW